MEPTDLRKAIEAGYRRKTLNDVERWFAVKDAILGVFLVWPGSQGLVTQTHAFDRIAQDLPAWRVGLFILGIASARFMSPHISSRILRIAPSGLASVLWLVFVTETARTSGVNFGAAMFFGFLAINVGMFLGRLSDG